MRPAPTASRLEAPHLKLLVAVLIQNETAYLEFRQKLTVDHFDDLHYKIVLLAVQALYEQTEKLPSDSEVWTEVESMINLDQDLGTDGDIQEIERFLNYAYNPKTFGSADPKGITNDVMTKFAYRAAKRLLQQRQVEQLQRELAEIDDLNALPAILSQAQSLADVIGMSSHTTEASVTFPAGWSKRKNSILRSSGVEFIDRLLNGGVKGGEVYMLMAPYGTCKTTIGTMLAVCAAKQCYEETLLPDSDGRIGLSVAISYEAPLSELQDRFLMYAAEISRNSLERMGETGIDALNNDPTAPLEYEKKRFKAQIDDATFIPERTRVEQVIPWLNDHLFVMDYSGSDQENQSAGYGGLDEIISRLKLEIRNRGGDKKVYIKNIVIDYLGTMADNDLSNSVYTGNKRPEDHKLYALNVKFINSKLAKAFGASVWVLHQLSGEANKQGSPTRKIDHTEAKGSRSVAENADFVLIVGSITEDEERLGQIACTKHRRTTAIAPRVIRVDGEFNTVFTPDGYRIIKGRITDEETAKSLDIGVNQPSSGPNFPILPAAEDDAAAADDSEPEDSEPLDDEVADQYADDADSEVEDD